MFFVVRIKTGRTKQMESLAKYELLQFANFSKNCVVKTQKVKINRVDWLNELHHLLKRPSRFNKISEILTIFEPKFYQNKTHYNV